MFMRCALCSTFRSNLAFSRRLLLVDVSRVFDGLDEMRLANIAATLRAVRRGFLAAKALAVGFVVLL
jgi:hypothetical protein